MWIVRTLNCPGRFKHHWCNDLCFTKLKLSCTWPDDTLTFWCGYLLVATGYMVHRNFCLHVKMYIKTVCSTNPSYYMLSYFCLYSTVCFFTWYLSVQLSDDTVPIVQPIGPGMSRRLDQVTSKGSFPPILYDNNDWD